MALHCHSRWTRPDRELAVTMMDWRNCNGTAKYWTLQLLLDYTAIGDSFVTTAVNSSSVYAQGYLHSVGGGDERLVVLINKQDAPASVTVNMATACTADVVDTATNQDPPRRDTYPMVCTVNLGPYSIAIVRLLP